jgi:hypothetical protein
MATSAQKILGNFRLLRPVFKEVVKKFAQEVEPSLSRQTLGELAIFTKEELGGSINKAALNTGKKLAKELLKNNAQRKAKGEEANIEKLVAIFLNKLKDLKTGKPSMVIVKPPVLRNFSKMLNNSTNSRRRKNNTVFMDVWMTFIDNNFKQIVNTANVPDVSVAEIEGMLDVLESNDELASPALIPISDIFETHSFDMYKYWQQKYAPPIPMTNNASKQNQNTYRNWMAQVN